VRSRLVRVGGSVAALAALLGGVTPAAQATTVLSAAFVGVWTLDGPLGYPCVGTGGALSTGTLDTRLCPTTKFNFTPNPNPLTLPGSTATTASHLTNPTQLNRTILHLITGGIILTAIPLTLPGIFGAVPQHHINLHHNTRRVVGLGQILCHDVGANVNKPGKAPTHAGACSFGLAVGTLPNTAAGNCDLASGQVTVTFTDALGQAYTLDIHFIQVRLLILEGHWRKVGTTQTGLVIGALDPVPPIPGTSTESCFNKTARTFELVGTLAMAG
jgi:hypothetical protein